MSDTVAAVCIVIIGLILFVVLVNTPRHTLVDPDSEMRNNRIPSVIGPVDSADAITVTLNIPDPTFLSNKPRGLFIKNENKIDAY